MSTSAMQTTPGWAGMPVLVTGATGFIGSHLLRRLYGLGADVHVASRQPQPENADPAWHSVDLADAKACLELIDIVRPQVVFHLASAATGARDVELVLPLMAANQAAAVNLLTAVAKSTPNARVVLAGSIEEPHQAHELTPRSPYAAAKAAATAYARMFHSLWQVRVSVLQIAMVYGPGQPDRTKLIPYTTLALLRDEAPKLSSGTRLVDWVYVDDVVDAFLTTAETDAAIGEVFDICSGRLISIHETVELLASIVGSEASPEFSAFADRPMDLAQRGDPRRAAELVKWKSATPLEVGLRKTVAWYAEDSLGGPPGGQGLGARVDRLPAMAENVRAKELHRC